MLPARAPDKVIFEFSILFIFILLETSLKHWDAVILVSAPLGKDWRTVVLFYGCDLESSPGLIKIQIHITMPITRLGTTLNALWFTDGYNIFRTQFLSA
ncbi:hypothetical protein F5146DRAFT_1143750 [Armillaria mellea]|nr:hypothetical protein F5146DRAFT_1143750 [Armillaria mellea]